MYHMLPYYLRVPRIPVLYYRYDTSMISRDISFFEGFFTQHVSVYRYRNQYSTVLYPGTSSSLAGAMRGSHAASVPGSDT